MIKNVVQISIVIILINLSLSLLSTTQDVFQKTIVFSEEMNKAVDCAVQGRPLEECSKLSTKEIDTYINGSITDLKEVEKLAKEYETQLYQ